MGVIQYADMDIDTEMANDEQVAEQLDAERDERLAHVRAIAGQA
jgi:hypothetical protein